VASTAAWIATSAASTGGLIAIVVKKLRTKDESARSPQAIAQNADSGGSDSGKEELSS
jgi:hypothetical protein